MKTSGSELARIILPFLVSLFFVTNLTGQTEEWKCRMILPAPDGHGVGIGVAAAFSGFVGGDLVIAGGANFPEGYPWEGGEKRWWRTLYAIDTACRTQSWTIMSDVMPHPVAYGVSIQLADGFLCIGGCDADRCMRSVVYVGKRSDGIYADTGSYPDLPVPLANACGTMLDESIYIMGGQSLMSGEYATNSCFVLDLNAENPEWKSFPAWDGSPRAYAVATAQAGKIYLFSGRNFSPGAKTETLFDGHCFDPSTGHWQRLEGDFPFMAGTAVAFSDNKIVFIGGVREMTSTHHQHLGFSNELYAYDTDDGSIRFVGASPYLLPVTVNALRSPNGTILLPSGEIRPGVRTPRIIELTLK